MAMVGYIEKENIFEHKAKDSKNREKNTNTGGEKVKY